MRVCASTLEGSSSPGKLSHYPISAALKSLTRTQAETFTLSWPSVCLQLVWAWIWAWNRYLSCLLLQEEFLYIAAARARQSALPWPPGMEAVEAMTQERAAQHPASQDLAPQDAAKRDQAAQEVANLGQAAKGLATGDQAAQEVNNLDQAAQEPAHRDQAAQEAANGDQAAQEPAHRDQAAQEAATPAGRRAHFKDADTEAALPLKRATMLKLPHLTDSAGSNTLGTFPLTCSDFVTSLESPIHHVPSAVALSVAVADDKCMTTCNFVTCNTCVKGCVS